MAIECEKIKEYGVLNSESANGYKKEVNMVSWSGGAPKIDIRVWQPSGKPGRGVTLNSAEFNKLKAILNEIEF